MTHVRTALYFGIFGGCLAYVLILTFPWRTLMRNRSMLTVVAPLTSMTSLFLTWRLILLFVAFTTHHRGRPDPPNLFVEAYVLVCVPRVGGGRVAACWVTGALSLTQRRFACASFREPLAMSRAHFRSGKPGIPAIFHPLGYPRPLPSTMRTSAEEAMLAAGPRPRRPKVRRPPLGRALPWHFSQRYCFLEVRAMRPVHRGPCGRPCRSRDTFRCELRSSNRIAKTRDCMRGHVYHAACIELHGPISARSRASRLQWWPPSQSCCRRLTQLVPSFHLHRCRLIDHRLAFICPAHVGGRGAGCAALLLAHTYHRTGAAPQQRVANGQEGAMLKRK